MKDKLNKVSSKWEQVKMEFRSALYWVRYCFSFT